MGLPKGASIPLGRERGPNPVRDFKLILDSEEIPYLAQGENFNLARNIPVRFVVPRDCFDQANEILADFL